MSVNGLDVFDRTVHVTNEWLGDIMHELDCDRQLAWHSLGAVLRALRDRLPADLAANLSAQLPILVRGAYYDQYNPARQPVVSRSLDEFLSHVDEGLATARPVDARASTEAVFHALRRHTDPPLGDKISHALPEELRALWQDGSAGGRA